MARVMLLNKDIPQKFWREAMNISCHIGNRIFFRVGTKKTSYEIVRDRQTWCLSKKERFFCAFSRHLSFWVSGVESPLIFYTKNNNNKKNSI